jgi:hypothetical protein
MDDIKNVKGLPFSGKRKDFKIWHFKFLAFCALHQCKEILTDPKLKAPRHDAVLDLSKDSDKAKLVIKKQNIKAYLLLTLSVTDPISYEAIQNATTEELPDGDAKKAFANLCNIFKPVAKTEQHDLEQQFHHCQLTEDSANPDKWFAKLDNIRLQLKIDHRIELNDDKVITQI